MILLGLTIAFYIFFPVVSPFLSLCSPRHPHPLPLLWYLWIAWIFFESHLDVSLNIIQMGHPFISILPIFVPFNWCIIPFVLNGNYWYIRAYNYILYFLLCCFSCFIPLLLLLLLLFFLILCGLLEHVLNPILIHS